MTKQRIAWIDMAKGLAMLMIFFSHSDLKINGFELNHLLQGVHLAILFVLSGYTMSIKSLDSQEINKKFKRLMVPYFSTAFIILLLDILNLIIRQKATILNVTHVISKDLTRSFFASGANTTFGTIEIGSRIGALWFLPALFFASILAQWCINNDTKRFVPILLLNIMILSYISAQYIWLPFSIQPGLFASGYVFIGYLIKKHNVIHNLTKTSFLFCLCSYSFIVIRKTTQAHISSLYFNDILINTVVGILGTIAILKIVRQLESVPIIRPFLTFVGQQSLLFLSLHIIELETLRFYLYHWFKDTHLSDSINMRITLIICFTILTMLFFKSHIPNKPVFINTDTTKRNKQFDMYKGLLILFMLMGHAIVDQTFRNIIYSFHMPAFIFISGYFYKPSQLPLTQQFTKLSKSFLRPYLIFSILYVLLHYPKQSINHMLSNLTMGMSFSKNILTQFQSVGPIYFVLLLFLVRILFIIINKITANIYYQVLICFILSLVGVYLGQNGLWLPWSLDIALYAIAIYALGYAFKYFDILTTIQANLWVYFISATIWTYAIFKSGIELALRHYNTFGIGLIGSIAGIITVFIFIQLLDLSRWHTLKKILANIGVYSIDVLLLHTLIDYLFVQFFIQFLNPNYIYFYILNISAQITTALIIGIIFKQFIPKIFKKTHIIKG